MSTEMLTIARRVERAGATRGVRYARRQAQGDSEKALARRALLRLLSQDLWPGRLAIVTMPGLSWEFEHQLLRSRETRSVWDAQEAPGKKARGMTRRTWITGLEDDPAVYLASLKSIPGAKLNIAQVDSASFARRSLKTPLVIRHHLATVEDFLEATDFRHDAMWLDFCGQLTERRVHGIRRVWREGLVRNLLSVTTLRARVVGKTRQGIIDAGSIAAFLQSLCSGSYLEHVIPYFDTSPMVQVTLRRAP